MRTLQMLSAAEALEAVLANPSSLQTETAPITAATGRFLPAPVAAPLSLPPFDKAAVDGIGVSADCLPAGEWLRVIGSIAAGDSATLVPRADECVKIMTGARVPAGVARIIRFEYTESEPGAASSSERMRIVREEFGANIAYAGEDIRAGKTLLHPRRLTPIDIGIAAWQGLAQLEVAVRPRVKVIATGSELYAPGQQRSTAGIFDSNSYQLCALAAANGGAVQNIGIVVDQPELLRQAIQPALNECELLILSGGVSKGDADFVPDVLMELGVERVFHGLALKPGHPTFFGRRGTTAVFALPGNPVSTIVQFELMIRPLLWQLQGVSFVPNTAELPLAQPFHRKTVEREEWLPARVVGGRLEFVGYQGSGHLAALADATVVGRIPLGTAGIAAGESVHARFIR